MIQSTDELAINCGFYAKANSSATRTSTETSLHNFSKELEDQLISGAIGLRLCESSGSTSSSIDSCLRLADFYDVSVILDTDSFGECYDSDLQSIFKNRVATIPFNSSQLTRAPTIFNEILTCSNFINISSLNDQSNLESGIEGYLHDLGIISAVCSSSFSFKTNQQVKS